MIDELVESASSCLLEANHELAHFDGIAIQEIIYETLEIGSDLNIHRWGETRSNGSFGVDPGFKKAVENVVLIGSHSKTAEGKTHLAKQPAGEDVAEIAGGNDESRLSAFFLR